MSPLADKCLWLIELLIKTDGPMPCSQLARTTGISYKIVDDCVWKLVQSGRIIITNKSLVMYDYTMAEIATAVGAWLDGGGHSSEMADHFEAMKNWPNRLANEKIGNLYPSIKHQIIRWVESKG